MASLSRVLKLFFIPGFRWQMERLKSSKWVYYTSDWDVASSTVVANLVCYDRLHFLRQQKAPKMPVFYNTTIAQAI